MTYFIRYGSILPMKVSRYYLVSILVIMLSLISFDISSPQSVDLVSETQVEIFPEEKESKTGYDYIADTPTYDLRDIYAFTGFYWVVPRIDLLYLNNIFKPPISLHF
ncbi:MAG: hypothetical protein PHO65_01155 [Sulfurovum sp.]|nr:hypothetical protein [Sulfurovum sp.]